MRLLLSALLIAATGSLVHAETVNKMSPLASHLPLRTEACFGRTYDAQHLATHPSQRVASFYLSREFASDPHSEEEPLSDKEAKDADGGEGRINVTAYVRFRNRKGVYANGLSCSKGDNGTVACAVDCDGGSFDLKPTGTALLLDNKGFVVVGGCGASEDEQENEVRVAPGSDDRTFRLDPKPVAACTAERDAMAPIWARLGVPLRARFKDNETLCLSRSYDDAHLRSHPKQTVKRIAILKTKDWKADPDDSVVKLSFRIETRDGKIVEKQTSCAPDRYAFSCSHTVAGDVALDFYLTRAPDNEVYLRDRRGVLAPMFGLKLGADDRIFRLKAEPESTCSF